MNHEEVQQKKVGRSRIWTGIGGNTDIWSEI